MSFIRLPRLLQAGVIFGMYVALDLLRHFDPSRLTMHLAGGAVVVAILPLMKWRPARLLQVIALGWLLADIVLWNRLTSVPVVRGDAGAWRGVLAMAYATIITLLGFYDRAMVGSRAGPARENGQA